MQEPGSRVVLVLGGGAELRSGLIDRLEPRGWFVLANGDGMEAVPWVQALPELHLLVVAEEIRDGVVPELLAAVAEAHPGARFILLRDDGQAGPRIHRSSNLRVLPSPPTAGELDGALAELGFAT
jgi:hypothetical protein